MLPVIVIFPLLIAGILIASGILKFPQRARTLSSFEAFGMPAPFRRPWAALALPVGEVLLGLAMLITSGPTYLVAAALSALLMAAYLVLVTRSVVRKQTVDCNCFGALSTRPVSRRTVARNGALFIVALAALLAPGTSEGVPALLAAFSASDWIWLSALAASVGVGVLSSILAARSAEPKLDDAPGKQPANLIDNPEARTRIPHHLELVSASGEPELLYNTVVIARKTTILVFGRVGCGSCAPVLERIPAWADDLAPHAQIVVATSTAREKMESAHPRIGPYVRYGSRAAYDYFDVMGTPAAVLLAADGTIASEPVYGLEEINERVSQLADSLRAL